MTNTDKISEFPDKCIIFKITEKMRKKRVSTYKTATHRWPARMSKASEADYVLAVIKGVVEKVYIPHGWYYETLENAKKHDDFEAESGGVYSNCPNKIAFFGKEADDDSRDKYLGKHLPDYYMRPGPGPVLYPVNYEESDDRRRLFDKIPAEKRGNFIFCKDGFIYDGGNSEFKSVKFSYEELSKNMAKFFSRNC
jgi:hypothetical protein